MAPSDAQWLSLIAALHASGRKAALGVTGGGSGAIGELLSVPGGSRLLLEAQVPYDAEALRNYLGFAPAQASSFDTAVAMARSALDRASKLAPAGADVVGLGATAALVSDRPRKGEHRFHIATVNSSGITHCTATLAKGRRNRAGEERLVARAIVLSLAAACGVGAPSVQTLLEADEPFATTPVVAADPIGQLVAGEVPRVSVEPDGQLVLSAPPRRLVMPGSFNPVHTGHVLLARVAEDIRQDPLAFEISVTNVDKPPLSAETVRRRLQQFAWTSAVELTRAPTFVEKARLFPGATFVIGADTAERLFAVKYYGDDEARMNAALDEFATLRGSFLVAVRIDGTGQLRSLGDIAVPRRYGDLFSEIPEHRFRLDASSSAIRAGAQASS